MHIIGIGGFSHQRYQLCLIRTGFTQFTQQKLATPPMARPARIGPVSSLAGAMQGEVDWASIQMKISG